MVARRDAGRALRRRWRDDLWRGYAATCGVGATSRTDGDWSWLTRFAQPTARGAEVDGVINRDFKIIGGQRHNQSFYSG
jgi:hypothetical protein